jgi:peptide/nickel transport system permease protein
MLGLVIFTLIFLGCVTAGFYMDYEENAIQQNMVERLQSPNRNHLLGTDQYGRDLLSRIIFGGRTSLVTALIVIIISTLIGAIIGAICGYYGGFTDNAIMRVNDVFYSIPYTLMAVCIVSSFGGGMVNLGIACIVAIIPGNIRLFRAWVMPLSEQEYIEAARAYGTKDRRILLRHIIPNTLGPIIVQATLHLAITVITVAGLSYLGLGVKSPTPSGVPCSPNRANTCATTRILSSRRGIAILISTLSLNLVGDGLRDALDPKLKN